MSKNAYKATFGPGSQFERNKKIHQELAAKYRCVAIECQESDEPVAAQSNNGSIDVTYQADCEMLQTGPSAQNQPRQLQQWAYQVTADYDEPAHNSSKPFPRTSGKRPEKVTKVGFTFEKLRTIKSVQPSVQRALEFWNIEEQASDSSLALRSDILSISHGDESYARLGISADEVVKSQGSKIRSNLRKLDAFHPI